VTLKSSRRPSAAKQASRTTLIWLVVRVPVLSEQMTVVQPRVSTDGRVRTIAFCFAIFLLQRRALSCTLLPGKPSKSFDQGSCCILCR